MMRSSGKLLPSVCSDHSRLSSPTADYNHVSLIWSSWCWLVVLLDNDTPYLWLNCITTEREREREGERERERGEWNLTKMTNTLHSNRSPSEFPTEFRSYLPFAFSLNFSSTQSQYHSEWVGWYCEQQGWRTFCCYSSPHHDASPFSFSSFRNYFPVCLSSSESSSSEESCYKCPAKDRQRKWESRNTPRILPSFLFFLLLEPLLLLCFIFSWSKREEEWILSGSHTDRIWISWAEDAHQGMILLELPHLHFSHLNCLLPPIT